MRDYQIERMKSLNKGDLDFSKQGLEDFYSTEIKDDDDISVEIQDLIKEKINKYINDLIDENKIDMKNTNKKNSSKNNKIKKKPNRYNKYMAMTMRDLKLENNPENSQNKLSIVAERWHALPKDDNGDTIWVPPSDEEMEKIKNDSTINKVEQPISSDESKVVKSKKKSIKKTKKEEQSEQSD
jgi:hypothetical protein